MSSIFYIDCEFNFKTQELISIALVDQDGLSEFYEVIEHSTDTLDPWVIENVIPHLNKPPVSRVTAQKRLSEYLPKDMFTIVADWPDDIGYFCSMLISGPGQAIEFRKCFFVVDRCLSSAKSSLPHNALEDARAIRCMGIKCIGKIKYTESVSHPPKLLC